MQLYINTGLQSLVGAFQGGQHDVFRKLLRPAFYHHNGFPGSRHNHVQLAAFQLFCCRIDDDLMVHIPHAYGANWPQERHVGYGKRGRSGDEGDDVRIILVVHGKYRAENLGFLGIAGGKERP